LSAQAPKFPQGAIIRTILKDYAPEELAGGATLFHEHMQTGFSRSFQKGLEKNRNVQCLCFLSDVAAIVLASPSIIDLSSSRYAESQQDYPIVCGSVRLSDCGGDRFGSGSCRPHDIHVPLRRLPWNRWKRR